MLWIFPFCEWRFQEAEAVCWCFPCRLRLVRSIELTVDGWVCPLVVLHSGMWSPAWVASVSLKTSFWISFLRFGKGYFLELNSYVSIVNMPMGR